jgi:tetratricopeptide repeat protein 21B
VAELPGLVVAQMEMARAHLAIGELEAAGAILEEAARVDPTSSECQLLLARVALAQENHRMASSHLEQALSNDFQVRSSPIYHLVKAQILGNQGALEEALMQLQEAGQLDGGGGAHMALSDRISIMLETMAVLSKLGRLQEAQAALTQAQGAARGSAEEVRVLLANAELAIRRNDVDGALKGLSGVPKGSPAYVQAQMFRANVYLTHRHDRRAYAQCYLDLVNSRADAATYVLLGEAYMRIQAPESAIEAFQAALDLNPSDNELAIKIGRALVSTHDYRKAMDYYESALVQAPHNGQLRQDLARLYSKLGKHTMAAGILQHSVENATAQTDMASLCVVVKNLLLLAEVHAASGDHDDVLDALTRAWNLQRSVLERCRGERPDLLPEQRRVAADICFRMGQHHNKVDDERAVECYNDALRIDEAFEPALVALARLHKRLGRPEDCARHCKTLLRINAKQAEQASMLLGELAFLKGDYDGATNHYRALLEKKPNNYPALVQLLALLRGAGKLDEAKGFIERAGAADPRSSSHLGMAFCKGLYHRYTRDVAEAVRYLNLARKDGEWAVRALEALIEIYVDPDGTLLSEEDISASEDSSAPAARADAAATENLKVRGCVVCRWLSMGWGVRVWLAL